MIDLTQEIKAVFAAKSDVAKRENLRIMIGKSHAKKETKLRALRELERMRGSKLDMFAVNYGMSGEGLKVV